MPTKQVIFKGIAAAPGLALGRVLRFEPGRIQAPTGKIAEDEIEGQVALLKKAREKARAELAQLTEEVRRDLGESHAAIFRAHDTILSDPLFEEESVRRIRQGRESAATAVEAAVREFLKAFRGVEDPYLRERAADVEDVAQRLLRHILGREAIGLDKAPPGTVIVARDLSPSDCVRLGSNVTALATEAGGPTGHTAIVARALKIPAVVGLLGLSENLRDGEMVLVDGSSGLVTAHPEGPALSRFRSEKRRLLRETKELRRLKALPAVTLDGRTVDLGANVEFPNEMALVRESGASGIGLYRTEFMFMDRRDLPTEDEQVQAYREAADAAAPGTIIIRTLDIGGDKLAGAFRLQPEDNPFLGLRGVRLSLAQRGLFRTQLRAVLRASAYGNVRVMFPLVSGVGELRMALNILESCRRDLAARRIRFDKNMKVGIMVEVPAAALQAEELGRMVDFFSIGSNDLIQYTLAVDRVNEAVAYLYDPIHPAVLKLIHRTVEGARQTGIWVGLCGEMAADPALTPLLLGLGLDELSMAPGSVPEVKKAVRQTHYRDAVRLASQALACESSAQVRLALDAFVKKETL